MLVQFLWTDNIVVCVIPPWNCVTGNGGVGCMIENQNQVITSNNKNGEGKINMVNDSELLIKAS